MRFSILTVFPDMFSSVLGASLVGKAVEKQLLDIAITDVRDFAPGKHRSTDDTPYGGGSGMVMRPDPLVAAVEHVENSRGRARKILLSPVGARLDQAIVRRLAAETHLMLVCSRYEGYDERVVASVDEELSIGDFVLTGGELGAMVVLDAVARLVPGVLGNADSPVDESFSHELLEYPQYTRPAEFRGAPVPDVLVSGNHERVRRWRRRESLLRTRDRRPDLFAKHALTDEDRRLLDGEEP